MSRGPLVDIVDGFIIKKDSHVSLLEERMGGEHNVVGLDHGGRDLSRRIDGEPSLEIRFFCHSQWKGAPIVESSIQN